MLVIGFGVWALSAGELTLGGLLVFITYLAQLYSPIRALAQLSNSIFAAAAGAERVLELLDEAPAVTDAPHARPLPAPVRGQRGAARRHLRASRRRPSRAARHLARRASPGRSSRSWARAAPASPRSRGCWCASPTPARARSASTATTCATSTLDVDAPSTSACCCRTPTCPTSAPARRSPTAARGPATHEIEAAARAAGIHEALAGAARGLRRRAIGPARRPPVRRRAPPSGDRPRVRARHAGADPRRADDGPRRGGARPAAEPLQALARGRTTIADQPRPRRSWAGPTA